MNEVSHTAIINYVHKANLFFRPYEEIPILTENHKLLVFCEKYNFSYFNDWIFSFVPQYNDSRTSYLYRKKKSESRAYGLDGYIKICENPNVH